MSFENNDGNKKKTKKLYRLMEKRAFYLILLLCLSIILTTAVWVSRQEEKHFAQENQQEEKVEEDKEDSQVEVILVEEEPPLVESKPRERPMLEDIPPARTGKKTDGLGEDIDKEEDEKKLEDEVSIATSGPGNHTMVQPVMGKLGLAFADDKLVYHKTLDHWSTHKGIDIHAQAGSPVRAALDGEVIEISNDIIMGITIVLSHDGNLITSYSNLSTDAMVELGQRVKKGQVISGVGKTASSKSLEGPLLHFQVLLDNKEIDPLKYLPAID